MEFYLLSIMFLFVAAGLIFFFPKKWRYCLLYFTVLLLLFLALRSLVGAKPESISVFSFLEKMDLPPLLFSAHPYGMIAVFGILLVGALSLLYGLEATKVSEQAASFCALAGAIGVVLSGNFITLFIFWEVLTFSTAALIFLRSTPHSLRMGYKFLFFHLAGGLFLLLGILQQYSATGSFALAVPEAGLIFFVLAIGVKAAFLPFHVWVVWGYPAVSFPVSVILAGLTTKVGVYAVARILPPDATIVLMGALMAVFGVVCALLQKKMRFLLSYLLISQVGYMIAGVAIGSSIGVDAGLLHMVNHMLYKALLFMSVGVLLFAGGTEDLHDFSSVGSDKSEEENVSPRWQSAPVATTGAVVGALTCAGVPFFSGYVGKYLIKEAIYGAGLAEWLLTIAAVGIPVVFCKLLYFGFVKGRVKVLRSVPVTMKASMIVLVVLCFLLGLRPQLLANLLPYGSSLSVYSTKGIAGALHLLALGMIAFIILRRFLAREICAPTWLSVEYLVYAPSTRFALHAFRFISRLDKGLDHFYGKSSKITRDLAQKTAQFDGAINRLYETSGGSVRKIAQGTAAFGKEPGEDVYKKAGGSSCEDSGKPSDSLTGWGQWGHSIRHRLQWKTGELDTKNLNFDSLLMAIMLGVFLFVLIRYVRYF